MSVSTRTVCCKLHVENAADAKLRETQAAFNAAATYCACRGLAARHHQQEHVASHRLWHYFALSSVLVLSLPVVPEIKAAEAVRAVRAAPQRHDRDTGKVVPRTCPSFRDDSSIRYDVRTYRLMPLDRVSLNTISGRVVCQLDLGDFQRHVSLRPDLDRSAALN